MGNSIRSLLLVDELDASDQVAIGSTNVGADVRVPLSVLADFIESLLTVPTALITQYAAPNASGFTVTVAPTTDGVSMWLQLSPGGAYAAGTVAMPAQASCVDGQEVLVTSTQAITTLTVSGSGATVVGAPATLAANGFFRLRYDGVSLKWYRVS